MSDSDIREAIQAAIDALEYRYDHEHGNDWSVGDARRAEKDTIEKDKHIDELMALMP